MAWGWGWGDLDLNPEVGCLWGHALICLWEPSPSLVWVSHAQAVGVFSGRGGLELSTSGAKWASSEGRLKAGTEEALLNPPPPRSPALQPQVLCNPEQQLLLYSQAHPCRKMSRVKPHTPASHAVCLMPLGVILPFSRHILCVYCLQVDTEGHLLQHQP